MNTPFDIQTLANWATIISLPVSIISGLITLMAYLWPNPDRSKLLQALKQSRSLLFYLFVAATFFWLGTRTSTIITDNSGSIVHMDFESPDEQAAWTSTDVSIVTRSSDYIFNGKFALAISTKGTLNDNYVLTKWNRPFKADIIIGRVYWPEQPSVNVVWAQFCVIGAGACNDFAVTPGQWNAFSVNLYHEKLRDQYQGLYLQGDIRVANPEQAYTFYVDGIELYTSPERP